MNILFVVYDNDSYIHWFPQGLAYVAAVLQKAGHTLTIYNQDVHHYPEEHLTRYLDTHEFDAVGVSVIGGYYQYHKLLRISQAINSAQKRPLYIIGGHGPSPDPTYFLKITQADVVVVGEGEVTSVHLFKALQDKTPLSEVTGIAYREGGKVVINPRQELITDIDTIPLPAYDLFPMEYYRLLRMPHATNADFIMPILSGRGCPFKCTFCYRMDDGFRARSNEAIIEEMQMLKKDYGITYFAFSDELLMSGEERTMVLCEDIIKADLKVKWDCNGRLNYAYPQVLALMKRAGCVFINYGIESMDNQILKNYRKGLDEKTIRTGIDATLKAGISPGLNIIFGNIGENRETLQKGVDFLLEYDDGAQMRTIRPVTPYPGSELYDIAIRKGLLKDCADFYEHKHTNSDLMAVNFTDLTDEEFYHALYDANNTLLNNYFKKKQESFRKQTYSLYMERNSNFRGYRQS